MFVFIFFLFPIAFNFPYSLTGRAYIYLALVLILLFLYLNNFTNTVSIFFLLFFVVCTERKTKFQCICFFSTNPLHFPMPYDIHSFIIIYSLYINTHPCDRSKVLAHLKNTNSHLHESRSFAARYTFDPQACSLFLVQ